jgi:hypothetical protein
MDKAAKDSVLQNSCQTANEHELQKKEERIIIDYYFIKLSLKIINE